MLKISQWDGLNNIYYFSFAGNQNTNYLPKINKRENIKGLFGSFKKKISCTLTQLADLKRLKNLPSCIY